MLTGEKSLNRRKFLATAAAAGAAACSYTQNSPWRVLSGEEARTLGAWCECLIPEDSDAGAKRAGVVRFIDIQLTRKYKRHRKLYAQALSALNLLGHHSIRVRIGVRETAAHPGGINIFGRGFGNYDQDVVLRLRCE